MRTADAMIIAISMLCGGFTSAAWVAPRPLCWVFMVLSAILFVMIRCAQ